MSRCDCAKIQREEEYLKNANPTTIPEQIVYMNRMKRKLDREKYEWERDLHGETNLCYPLWRPNSLIKADPYEDYYKRRQQDLGISQLPAAPIQGNVGHIEGGITACKVFFGIFIFFAVVCLGMGVLNWDDPTNNYWMRTLSLGIIMPMELILAGIMGIVWGVLEHRLNKKGY